MNKYNNDNDKWHLLSDKHFRLFMLMNKWTRLLQDKKSVTEFFVKANYRRIAIYGFGTVGETLERELRDTDIKISYIVDKNADYLYAPVKIVHPSDKLDDVDIMVVTVFDNLEKIIYDLQLRCNFKIVSVEDVIKEV